MLTRLAPSMLVALALGLSGCTNIHRENDWKDVFTFTVGEGYGIKAAAGPAQLGIYNGNDMSGLRAGETGSNWGRIANYDYVHLVHGKEHFDGWMDNRGPTTRGKVTAAEYYFPIFVLPAATDPYSREDIFTQERKVTDGSRNRAYWTRLEIAMGFGYTVRVGFNPGELLDALLGYVGVDIYGDDITFAEREAARAHLYENPESSPEPESVTIPLRHPKK